MPPRINSIQPLWAVEGGRVSINGSGFPVDPTLPSIKIGNADARVAFASPSTVTVIVPPGIEGGRAPVRVEGLMGETALLDVGTPIATGLHQIDNPVFDRQGNLYLTFSGSRGQEVPVSIFRVAPGGRRDSFASGIVNPTSMTFDAAGNLYVSSRFEGSVYRVKPDGSHETIASDLGIACGLAFGRDGVLYVGDRSGTIFAIDPDGTTSNIATLPTSVAAFHLAMGPDDNLYVTGPTLGSFDYLYRIDPRMKHVSQIYGGFGRPQGLAFDSQGALYVVDALAGWAGLYRIRLDQVELKPELVLAAPSLVGVAIDPTGGLVVSSNDTAYRFDVQIRPLTT